MKAKPKATSQLKQCNSQRNDNQRNAMNKQNKTIKKKAKPKST